MKSFTDIEPQKKKSAPSLLEAIATGAEYIPSEPIAAEEDANARPATEMPAEPKKRAQKGSTPHHGGSRNRAKTNTEKPKTRRYNLLLADELHNQIALLAEFNELSVNELINRVLGEYALKNADAIAMQANFKEYKKQSLGGKK